MKKTILVLLTALIAINCNADFRDANKTVPENVLKSFSQQYPQVNPQKWDITHDTFIARFTMSKRKTKAFYLSDGNWIKTESIIRWSYQLPKAVKNGWNHCSLCSWYIDEIKQLEFPDKKIYTIQVHKELGPAGSIPGDLTDVYVLYFDANGKVIKKEHKE